jgi:hypothetical protein
MKVRIPVITETTPGSRQFSAAVRIEAACELVEPPEGPFYLVRLLEPVAGLQVGAEITVPATEVIVT